MDKPTGVGKKVTWQLGAGISIEINGDTNMLGGSAGITVIGNEDTTPTISFRSTIAGKTITSNGVSFDDVLIKFDGIDGSWILQDELNMAAVSGYSSLEVSAGTFDAND